MNSLIKPLLLGAAFAIGLAGLSPANAHTPRGPEQRMLQRAHIAKMRLARAAHRHPELAVALDLRRLEMLYRRSGQEGQIVAMYQDLLQRTEHPKLRAFAERRLRHAERVTHPERTIAELRARVDDKLSKLR